nr:hypothetical protein [Tanacetum cinerariifolium]
IGFLQKVPDSAHPITPKKYCPDPSEKTLPPLEGTELLFVGAFSAVLALVLFGLPPLFLRSK